MNRRLFLKSIAAIGVSADVFLSSCASVSSMNGSKKPNVILISADDIGYGDVECYGCEDIPTPNIDAIASIGTKFTRFYSSSPVCSPARGCMLTGLYPQRLGLEGPLMGEGGLSSNFVTLAKVLVQNGYYTGSIGKWHLGYQGDNLPNKHGFDYFYGHRGGKIDFYKYTDTAQKVKGQPLGKHDLYANETEVFEDDYATQVFTDKAIEFLESHSDKPFFLNLAYNAPHYSRPGFLQAPPEYIRRFTDSDKPTLRDIYRAMVACMDDCIGKIQVKLNELKIMHNTMVIFVGDNGADIKNGGSNGILKGGKWTLWEGGLRVPFIVKLPDSSSQVKIISQPVHMFDIFPTVIDICKLDYNGMLDGISLAGCLDGDATIPQRDFFFSYGEQKAVCNEKYKFIVIDGKEFLFDILTDIQESDNVISSHEDIHKELSDKYDLWRETCSYHNY